jgi:hypothetical protein
VKIVNQKIDGEDGAIARLLKKCGERIICNAQKMVAAHDPSLVKLGHGDIEKLFGRK